MLPPPTIIFYLPYIPTDGLIAYYCTFEGDCTYPLYVPYELTHFNSVNPDGFKRLKDENKLNYNERLSKVQNEYQINNNVVLINKSHYGQIGLIQSYIDQRNNKRNICGVRKMIEQAKTFLFQKENSRYCSKEKFSSEELIIDVIE